ncbi:hypothetical protein JW948_01910 [bacterium]|nr:hypothetical protein [bacterium]
MKSIHRRLNFRKWIWHIPVLMIILCGCRGSLSLNPVPVSGTWVSGIPFVINHVDLEVSHDNRIYETDHFLVFSDASSDAVKMDFAEKAERALKEVMLIFQIADAADLGIVDQGTKITVYTHKEYERGQLAFPYGYILNGQDSEYYASWPAVMKPRYYRQMKHETVHVVQFLLGVLPNHNEPENEPDRWFNEGLAETVSGGFFIPVTSRYELEQWKHGNGHINPVSVHRWEDLPISKYDVGEYYPVFGLAFRYLIDKKGLGKSMRDVRAMFSDLADRTTHFEVAFEKHMGIRLADYESSFFDRMAAYLE